MSPEDQPARPYFRYHAESPVNMRYEARSLGSEAVFHPVISWSNPEWKNMYCILVTLETSHLERSWLNSFPISMSSDGTRVAIGAPYNKGNFGDRDGHVRVYYLQIPPCDASAAPTNGNVGDCTSSLASGSTCQPTCTSGYTVSGTSSCSLGTLTAATCSLPPTNYCLPSQDWQYHCGPEPYTGSLTCPIAQLSCGGGCNDATTGSTYDQCNQCLSNGHKGLDGGTTCDGSCTLGDISDPCFKGFTPPPSPPPSANMTLPPPPPTPPSPKELVLDDDDHAAGLASFIMVLVATTVNILLTL